VEGGGGGGGGGEVQKYRLLKIFVGSFGLFCFFLTEGIVLDPSYDV